MMAQAQRCPVCLGKGIVAPGFYVTPGRTWTSGSSAPESCRSCAGKGYIVISDPVWEPLKNRSTSVTAEQPFRIHISSEVSS